MKYIRLLIFSAVFLFLTVTGISMFIPSRVVISRAINVAAPPAVVDAPVKQMQGWATWNPFFQDIADSLFRFIPGTKPANDTMVVNGTTVTWQKFQNHDYEAKLERGSSEPVINGWEFVSHEHSDSLTIQWFMEFNLKWYPWEKFGSLMFEKSYGPAMEQGLTNLRTLLHAGQHKE